MNMNTTENEIRARIQIMLNLLYEAKKIGDELCDKFYLGEFIHDMVKEILSYGFKENEVDEIMENLRIVGCFNDSRITEEDNDINVPIYKYYSPHTVEIIKPCNGGSLSSYVSESDFDTAQAGVIWKDLNCDDLPILDLCMAEVRNGELAEICGRDADNKDIDIMLWGDPFSEDYTDKKTIAYKDILDI